MVVIATSSLLLTGCDPDAAFPNFDTPPPGETNRPTAAPDDPALDDDTLFVVSVTTTDATGDPVQLELVGHASQEWNAPGRDEVKQTYVEQCTALGGGTVSDFEDALDDESLDAYGSTLMVLDVTSTPAGRTLSGAIELQLGSPYYYLVAAGDGLENPSASGCYGGYQLVSTGAVSAIVNYETGSSTADLSQWRTGRYGFVASYGSPAFSDCTVELTALAIESDVGDVDGWSPDDGTETECAIGYRGE